MDRNELIRLELKNGKGKPGIAVVKFLTNVLSGELFRELNNVLDDLDRVLQNTDSDNKLTGIIFTSDKDKIFLAGADLFYLNENKK